MRRAALTIILAAVCVGDARTQIRRGPVFVAVAADFRAGGDGHTAFAPALTVYPPPAMPVPATRGANDLRHLVRYGAVGGDSGNGDYLLALTATRFNPLKPPCQTMGFGYNFGPPMQTLDRSKGASIGWAIEAPFYEGDNAFAFYEVHPAVFMDVAGFAHRMMSVRCREDGTEDVILLRGTKTVFQTVDGSVVGMVTGQGYGFGRQGGIGNEDALLRKDGSFRPAKLDPATAPPLSLFVDRATGALTWKNGAGVLTAVAK